KNRDCPYFSASGYRDADSFFLQRAHQRPGVLAVARLDQEFDFGRAYRGGAEDTLVLYLDDVAAGIGDQLRHFGEAAGDVGHRDAQAHQAGVTHQAPHENRGEHAAVDVAAGDWDADALAGEALRMLEKRGERRGAGAFGDRFFDFNERDDGALDRLLGDDHHVLDLLLDDAEGDVADVLHRDALGDGVAADLDRLPRE